MADPWPGHRTGYDLDAPLWAALLGGDLDAFDALYDRHAEAVHRLLVRRVGAQDAPDLTAEVFTRAWAHRDRIRLADPGGLRPWLLGTALNVARTHTERAASAGRLTERLAHRSPLPDDSIAELIDTLDDAAALPHAHTALASLSLEDQEVLTLCLLEGLTPTDAALALGQRPSSVRSRLTRARRRLTTAYERTWTEANPS
jgi:RNA polymerase sigma factor (sigma-70 family)